MKVSSRNVTLASKPVSRAVAPSIHTAKAALSIAAQVWFVTAVLGQGLFAAYVIGFYGRAAVQGKFEVWNKVLPHGFVPGDLAGNLVVGLHLLFTVVVLAGGALQLLPQLRQRWPRFHHWSGRVYLLAAAVLSVGGLVMVWTRGAVGGLSQHIGLSLNALVILACGAMALHHARARRISEHRRWALRLFLAVAGVWFFRVGLMLWLVLNQGPVGFDPDTFQGPFLTIWTFGQYLLPLFVLELYFRAQRSTRPGTQFAMAGGLGLLTLFMAAGITAAALMMWWPKLS